MSLMSFMDRDNDGSSIDDGFTMASGLGAAGLASLGGLGAAVGTGIAGVGGAVMTVAGMEAMTGVGMLPAIPTALLGGALIAGGGLIGAGGAGLVGMGGCLGALGATGMAEEIGDFTADLSGMRGPKPFADKDCTDMQYASGNNDAPGQQLHDFLFAE